MTAGFGAPGSGIDRRDFVKAAGALAVAAGLAGCTSGSGSSTAASATATPTESTAEQNDRPFTGPPGGRRLRGVRTDARRPAPY